MLDDLFLEAYPLARRTAQVRSAAAVGALCRAGLDRNDFEQELMLTVWLKLRSFDPLRASLPTFLERVSATKAASIVRKGKTRKRTPVDSGHAPIATVHIGFSVELRVDVGCALRTLSRADQKMARLLVHHKPAEIARRYGISRAAIYRSKDRIASALKRFGLEKY